LGKRNAASWRGNEAHPLKSGLATCNAIIITAALAPA
jgi:hypothetical protein